MKDWQKNREREKARRVSFYLETYFTLSSYVLNSGADLKTWISRIFKVLDERYFLFCFSNVSPNIVLLSSRKAFLVRRAGATSSMSNCCVEIAEVTS